MRTVLLMVVLSLLGCSVQAAEEVFHPDSLRKEVEISVLYADIDYDVTQYRPVREHEHKAFMVAIGRKITDYLSIEFRIGRGNGSEIPADVGGSVNQNLGRLLGGYGRFGWQVADRFEPYVLVGFTDINRENSNWLMDTEKRDKGFSYAGGLNVKLTPVLSLRIESARLLDEDLANVTSTVAGMMFTF